MGGTEVVGSIQSPSCAQRGGASISARAAPLKMIRATCQASMCMGEAHACVHVRVGRVRHVHVHEHAMDIHRFIISLIDACYSSAVLYVFRYPCKHAQGCMCKHAQGCMCIYAPLQYLPR